MEEQEQQPGVFRAPSAAPWGSPDWESILPDQATELVLESSDMCTTCLLLQHRIPQGPDKPHQPRGQLEEQWCGAGRAPLTTTSQSSGPGSLSWPSAPQGRHRQWEEELKTTAWGRLHCSSEPG